MNCEAMHRVLDAFLDGELDPATAAGVSQHLDGCSACSVLLGSRSVLRVRLRQLPRHYASPQLRSALRRSLDHTDFEARRPPGLDGTDDTRRVHRDQHWAWVFWLGFGVAMGYGLALWISAAPPSYEQRDPLLARHVASFEEGEPRIDVASADSHVVKPWFAGKLDFAPTVRNLSQQGFELLGGRLDSLGGKPAAVLVYRVRRHHISVFVLRSQESEQGAAVSTLRGFAFVTWVHDGLTHFAVSDVNPRDLQRFADLMRSGL